MTSFAYAAQIAAAKLAGVSQALLPDSAAIQRKGAVASDGAGGFTAATYTTVATEACRVMPVANNQPDEDLAAGQLRTAIPWRIAFRLGADVRLDDRLLVNGAQSFEVTGVLGPRSYEVERIALALPR